MLANNCSELALFLFITGSLYIVNPNFIAFVYIRWIISGIIGFVISLIMSTPIVKALRGELHLTSILDLSALNAQELISLGVTVMLVLFFFNNILMEHFNERTKKRAQDKLYDLRLQRSKVSRIDRDSYERQAKTYTRSQVN